MEGSKFNKDKLIEYWLESSDYDFETMLALYDSKRYSWSLFIGHLVIEKLLKAYFVKINLDYPPLIHNLLRLAEKSGIDLTKSHQEKLVTITAFNINARYDDYKMSFNRRCTPSFTKDGLSK